MLYAEAAGSSDHMCDCEGDLDDGVLDDRNGAHNNLPWHSANNQISLSFTALLCRDPLSLTPVWSLRISHAVVASNPGSAVKIGAGETPGATVS